MHNFLLSLSYLLLGLLLILVTGRKTGEVFTNYEWCLALAFWPIFILSFILDGIDTLNRKL